MKYHAPKYETHTVETKDILMVSSEKYEIESNGDSSGNIIMNALYIFN